MIPFLLFLAITSVAANNCSYFYDGQYYTRSSILTIKGLPTNLAYNPNTKDIFFTLIDIESLQSDDVQTKMDQYILRNDMPIKVDNINGQAAAVDVKNNRVYVATDEGLFALNKTDKANFVSLKEEDIVQLFKPSHKEEIYTVIFPENDVYVVNLKKNEKKKVPNIPCAFIIAVDADDNIYYECDSKYVKVLLRGFIDPIEFVGIPKNSGRAIAVDDKNRVILAANDGLYHLRPDNLIPKKLMDLDFVPSGIAFDGDTLYLATNGIIYKYNGDHCE